MKPLVILEGDAIDADARGRATRDYVAQHWSKIAPALRKAEGREGCVVAMPGRAWILAGLHVAVETPGSIADGACFATPIPADILPDLVGVATGFNVGRALAEARARKPAEARPVILVVAVPFEGRLWPSVVVVDLALAMATTGMVKGGDA